MSFGSIFSASVFWKRIDNDFLLKCLVKFFSVSIWAWCFLCWTVIDYSVSLIGLGRSSVVWVLADCVFQGIGLFHVGYWVVDIVFLDLFLYYPFDVHGIYSGVLNLIFDISYLSSFSLVTLVRNLFVLIFPKIELLVLLVFFSIDLLF